MPKLLILAFLAATAALNVGCATIFTGTEQKIRIESDPPEATVIVVGGSMGKLIQHAKKVSYVTQKIVGWLEPHLPPDVVEVLRKLDVDELVTVLVLWLKLDTIPTEIVQVSREALARLPRSIVKDILEFVGLREFGAAPFTARLDKGDSYAVIAWKEGHRAKVASIGTSFNWVVLVNVFNLFIGAFIDVFSGAWLNLRPETLRLSLQKR